MLDGPATSKKRKRGGSVATKMTETGCEYCNGDDEELLNLLRDEQTCSQCLRPLKNTSRRGCSTAGSADGLLSPMSNVGSKSPSSAASSQPASPVAANSPGFQYANTTPSSKLMAVVGNIENHRQESKSIVFTSWQYTLDALADLLTARQIRFCQVDGRVKPDEREAIFTRFKEEPSISVLLLTIQTGAVGLTLTVANRVHFVEPQWNPAVEEQAIGRALRMGQTKQVTVIKYIVEKSVEESIVTMQKRKSYLARVTLDAAEHKEEATGLDDLRFLLDHDIPVDENSNLEKVDHDMMDQETADHDMADHDMQDQVY